MEDAATQSLGNKPMFKSLITAASPLLTLGAGSALAESRVYIGAGVGGALPGTSIFEATNDVTLPGDDFETILTERIDLDLNGGVAAAGWVGYRLTPNFSIEIERFIQNTTFDDDLVDDDFDALALFGFEDENLSIGMWSANVVMAAPTEQGLIPYIGLGLGLATFDTNEDQLDGFEGDNPLAFQLKGGVQAPLTPNLSLGLQMRYFTLVEAFERTFERDVIQPNLSVVTTELSEELDYSGTDIMLTLNINF